MWLKLALHLLGEDASRMGWMLSANVDTPQARLSFNNLVWVGTVELKQRTGNNSLTVFDDLMAKKIFSAIPEKDTVVSAAFAVEL